MFRQLPYRLARKYPKLYYGKLSWLFTSIHSLGIEFLWHGDWIIWLWPWKRREGKRRKFLSTSFQATFNSLWEIDDLWQQYFAHLENDNAQSSQQ